MDEGFRKLKEKSMSGELLAQYAFQTRYNLGTHKRIRLRRAGVEKSGSLLHDDVAKSHATKLFQELNRRAKAIGSEADDRLRFMTVLQAVVDPTIEAVEAEVVRLETAFKSMLGSMRLWSRGSIELEMVNLNILERIKTAREDEGRKLNVLNSLMPLKEFQGLMVPDDKTKSKILVHCHVVVDLGKDHARNLELLMDKKKRETSWNTTAYQVEIKGLFKNRTAAKNLNAIAAYVTKGGNENLRYSAGFGRDLAEDLEAKIWRVGLLDKDEKVDDERGLTVGEVQQLDQLYVWLMRRRRDRRGYIIGTSDR